MRTSPGQASQPLEPGAFTRDVESVADFEGTPFGRLELYWEAESRHVEEMRYWQAGPIMVARASLCLYLETVEHLNRGADAVPPDTKLTFYSRFVPKLLTCFHQLCGADLLATHGYPLQAYAQLRNTFEHLLLISAAMQGLSDFFQLEGYDISEPYDVQKARKKRLKCQREVREAMAGSKSGLSPKSIEDLRLWIDLFNLEVHGSKLSFTAAIGWIQGNEPLTVYPKYQQLPATMYGNRVCEVAWMAHRLLPLLQHSAMRFSDEWDDKWRALDRRFRDIVRHSADQQELKVGLAVIELLETKFPFSESTLYPLEGLEMPIGN